MPAAPDATSLSTAETVLFAALVLVCAALAPVVARHARGTGAAVDDAVRSMQGSFGLDDRKAARIAGTVHLSWVSVASASVAVLAGDRGVDGVAFAAVALFAVCGTLDMSVLLTGRPRRAVLRRYRPHA